MHGGFEDASCVLEEELMPPPASEYVISCGGRGFLLDGGIFIGLELDKLLHRYPFSHGHIAQHPPQGSAPSLLEIPIDFVYASTDAKKVPYNFQGQDTVLQGLKTSIPSLTQGGALSNGGTSIPGLALLLSKDVKKGEELFLDYQYGTASKFPQWYSPVMPSLKWEMLRESEKRAGLTLSTPPSRVDEKWLNIN